MARGGTTPKQKLQMAAQPLLPGSIINGEITVAYEIRAVSLRPLLCLPRKPINTNALKNSGAAAGTGTGFKLPN